MVRVIDKGDLNKIDKKAFQKLVTFFSTASYDEIMAFFDNLDNSITNRCDTILYG